MVETIRDTYLPPYYTTHCTGAIKGKMEDRQRLQVKTVGVIGAGVSGVASAVHLRKAGLQVTVFERNSHVGGVWCVARSFISLFFRFMTEDVDGVGIH